MTDLLFDDLPTRTRPLRPVFGVTSTWRPPTTLPSLKGVKKICVDVETCDPTLDEIGPGELRDGYIAGIGLAIDDGPRMYFPVRHEGGDNLDVDLVMRWARAEFGAFRGEVVGAKLLYDLSFLAAERTGGIFFHNASAFHDVQVAEVLLDDWRYSYSLDDISTDYLGFGKDETLLRRIAPQFKWKTDKDVKKNLWRLPGRYVGQYAEGDVDRPLLILPKQLARLEAEGLMPVYTIERKLTPILLGMRRRGVRIDTARAEMIGRDLERRIEEQVKIIRSFAGPKAELTEVASWVHALKEAGLKLEKTPSGKISTAKAWLEKNQRHPLIAAIMLGRKYHTAKNTFVDGHLSKHLINGRVHCEYIQLKNDDGRGTAARFASANPNMQNVPARDEEMAQLIRGAFLPDEGERWQRDDYSQIEYRLLVHFAVGRGAEEARERYRNDPKTDYHKFCATMLGVDPEDKIKRKRVKNTNFAKGYGAQVPKLAETFGCSIDEAKAFVSEYEAALPFTVDTFQAADRWAQKRGFIVSVLNRRARFPFWVPKGLRGRDRHLAENSPLPHDQAIERWGEHRIERANTYKALNNKLQFSSADITKKGMVDAYEAGIYAPDALGFPLVSVHDESGASKGRSAKAEEAGRELTRIMERAVTLRVPVLVESGTADNWAEAS